MPVSGRHADAAAAAVGALELSRQRAERGVEARVLYLLAEIAAHGQAIEVETAFDRYQQAASLADALGQRPLVAHCHLGLGKLYWRTAKRAEAEAELSVPRNYTARWVCRSGCNGRKRKFASLANRARPPTVAL